MAAVVAAAERCERQHQLICGAFLDVYEMIC